MRLSSARLPLLLAATLALVAACAKEPPKQQRPKADDTTLPGLTPAPRDAVQATPVR